MKKIRAKRELLHTPHDYLAALAIFILPACAAPTIKILEPIEGSVVPAGNVTVTVEVNGFDLVNKIGQTNVEGEGHILYYMDAAIPTTPGKPAITAPGTYISSDNTSCGWKMTAEDVTVKLKEIGIFKATGKSCCPYFISKSPKF